jgi:hypothetical protein
MGLRKAPAAGLAAGIAVIVGLVLTLDPLGAVAPTTPTAPRSPAVTPPEDLVVLIAGDSVPLHLVDTLGQVLRDTLGAELVSAAVPVCSMYGDPLAWPTGEPKGDPTRCPGLVGPGQTAMIQQHDPDVVIWWDRLSTMPILTPEGDFVKSGTDRFWELRAAAFAETLARVRAGGAKVVFVATEPIGIGFVERCAGNTSRNCAWRRFRMRRYGDVTQPHNRMLRRYAADHPDEAVFITITDTICRWNVSPCDDRLGNGALARPDGTHYEGWGELRAAKALVRDMRAALYG